MPDAQPLRRSATGLALVVLLGAAGGCLADPATAPADPSGLWGIPTLAFGDSGRYVSLADASKAFDFEVVGEGDVLDADFRRRPAVLVERRTSAGVVLTDALDPRSGALVWSATSCVEKEPDGACKDRTVTWFFLEGRAGFLGVPALAAAARSGGAAPDGDGCVAVSESAPDATAMIFWETMTPIGAFRETAFRFCADTPVPVEIRAPRVAYRLETFRRGIGAPALGWEPAALDRAPPRGTLRWDGGPPPGEEPPWPLGVREAWAWLAANSATFADYRERHPDAVLAETKVDGVERGSGPPLPVLEEEKRAHVVRRLLELETPRGERATFVLEKPWLGRLPPQIRLAEESTTTSPPRLDASAIPQAVVPVGEATSLFATRVPGEWVDTQLTPFGKPFYRVLVRPPDATASAGVSARFLFGGVLGADDGRLVFSYAPARFSLPG